MSMIVNDPQKNIKTFSMSISFKSMCIILFRLLYPIEMITIFRIRICVIKWLLYVKNLWYDQNLAYVYANRGACLALSARREDILWEVASRCRQIRTSNVISIQGELPQAFCRCAAVKGCLYVSPVIFAYCWY